MNNFDNIKSLSLDGFAEWLDSLAYNEDAPWNVWFDNAYCNKCKSIECSHAEYWGEDKEPFCHGTITCGYCELHNKCKFFPDLDTPLDTVEVIKLWLRREVDS